MIGRDAIGFLRGRLSGNDGLGDWDDDWDCGGVCIAVVVCDQCSDSIPVTGFTRAIELDWQYDVHC